MINCNILRVKEKLEDSDNIKIYKEKCGVK